MTQEALKLALEALEEAWYHVGTFQPTEKAIDLYNEARTAIKEALRENAMREVQRLGQEIEQEPVAYWKEHAQGLQRDYDSLLADFQAQQEERNFCQRCGKRTKEIHTCTPPQENT
jgi:hypothetical protein